MKHLIIASLLSLLFPTLLRGQVFDITSFGAIPDGKTLSTLAIQAAIDSAHTAGGGQVVIPKGTFLSGSVVLKSGVELHVSAKATLLGSTRPTDYFALNRWQALILAEGQNDIAITGKGTIDGQGAELALSIDSLFYVGQLDSADYEWKERRPRVTVRPQVIELVKCHDIRISGITIQHAASWVQSYDLCTHLTIDGIRVESDTYWNNDGIDIINCQHVLIRNCYINASDDGICLKSYLYPQPGTGRYIRTGIEVCDSITIENCTVRSSASAVKFGTASYGVFRNIVIRDIKVFDTFRSAIAIEMVGGGLIEKVLVENIRATNTGNAIFVRLGHRRKKDEPGSIRDITLRNIRVKVPANSPDRDYQIRGPALPFFHNVFPSSITGIPGHPVERITLENIHIIYPGGGNPAYAHLPTWRVEQVPEQIDTYPEFSMFGELPAWGLYVRHVKELNMRDVRIRIRQPDYRPAMVFEDVQGLARESIDIRGDNKENLIFLKKVSPIIDSK